MNIENTIKDYINNAKNPASAKSRIQEILKLTRQQEKKIDGQAAADAEKRMRIARIRDINNVINDYIQSGATEHDIFNVISKHQSHAQTATNIFRIHADKIRQECRDAEIWRRVAISKEKMADIGRDLGLSRSRICQIYNKYKKNRPMNVHRAILIASLEKL